jgi:hypothetical protein
MLRSEVKTSLGDELSHQFRGGLSTHKLVELRASMINFFHRHKPVSDCNLWFREGLEGEKFQRQIRIERRDRCESIIAVMALRLPQTDD